MPWFANSSVRHVNILRCDNRVEELGKLRNFSVIVGEFIIRTQMNHKIKNCGGVLIIIFQHNTEYPTVVSETYRCTYILILQRHNIFVSTIHHGKWLFIHVYS